MMKFYKDENVITALERELLAAICTTCNLKDVDIGAIGSDDPLLGPDSPLGLDSLDALEIVVMVQKEYGVRIESENTSRIVLQSVATLAAHIARSRPLTSNDPEQNVSHGKSAALRDHP